MEVRVRRIVIVDEMFMNPTTSGVTIYTLCLYHLLVSLGFEVKVVCANGKLPRISESDLIRLPSYRLGSHRFSSPLVVRQRTLARWLKLLPGLGKLIIASADLRSIRAQIGNADAVVSWGPFASSRTVRLATSGLAIPHVMVLHVLMDYYMNAMADNLKVRGIKLPLPKRTLTRWLLALASGIANSYHRVFALSHPLQRDATRWGIRNVGHIVAGTRFLPEANMDKAWELASELGIHGKKVFVYVGRGAAEKNIKTLIRAFAKIHQLMPDTILIFVGDFPSPQYEKEVRLLCHEKGVEQAVIFLGHVDREEVSQVLALASAFVSASESEILSLAILEALEKGLPIVAPAAAGNPEACGVAGELLVYYSNQDELADRLAEGMWRVAKELSLRQRLRELASEHLAMNDYSIAGFWRRLEHEIFLF